MTSKSDKAARTADVVGIGAVAIAGPSASATVSVRPNFALNHLRAAMRAARSAYEVEQNNVAAEFGPWFEDMLMLVPVSIVMAGAALEANANEIVQNILDGSTGLSVTEARKQLVIDLKEDRSGNSMDKYRRLALLFDKVPSKGEAAWQSAELLVKFRNALMHFKPAWDHEKDVHDGKLATALRNKIPTHPAYQTSFQFPHGYMTYGCARWSVLGVLAFSKAFSALLGVNDSLGKWQLSSELPTPVS
ncbi:hypothetical protein [Muricoccus nepalensis]|uniref:hypothetical protein n=1 Tax=Muricoccus nepalensis TaxID=1854500 RepID=UPI0011284538|nr:hypothetical protein [Roseomonas nepalensis]